MTRDQFLCEKVMGERWEIAVEEYACHCDIFDGEEPDECVLDSDEYNEDDCIYARKGMDKKKCEYWKPVQKYITNPNFSLWPDKGRLLDFVMGQEWWDEFFWFCLDKTTEDCYFSEAIKYLIDNLADLVATYRGWKG